MIDVLGPEKCRWRCVQEKIVIVQQNFESGITASLVARQLFQWRKQYQEDSLIACCW